MRLLLHKIRGTVHLLCKTFDMMTPASRTPPDQIQDNFPVYNADAHDTIFLQGPFEKPNSNVQRSKFLIFHITGNPALIEYYRDFLTHIHTTLSPHAKVLNYYFQIYGKSLPGFEVSSHSSNSNEPSDSIPQRVKGLEGQIQAAYSTLQNALQSYSEDGNLTDNPGVILIGHSVGAYIALEVIRSVQLGRFRNLQNDLDVRFQHTPRIISAICLFPTVVDIAKSRCGRILTPLSKIPYFPEIASGVVNLLTTILSQDTLLGLVKRITGMPARAAAITAAFLSSDTGVKAALAMARDEMRLITADRWDNEVWGTEYESEIGEQRPKLFFYFGEDDHWVADHTRDNLIAARGRIREGEEWKPVMEIDDLGIPHGFCIRHSDKVAEKVVAYVMEVVNVDLER